MFKNIFEDVGDVVVFIVFGSGFLIVLLLIFWAMASSLLGIGEVDLAYIPTADIIAELLSRYDVAITLQEGGVIND
ncbi:MAG: hypothetical protein FWG63_02975 [Defluviitaleaceae bacterium]|nr:hypothetical protein [Defluviitaleaceae bacterium]